ANSAIDADGSIVKVEFYRDSNNNGVLDIGGANPDALLGSDTNSAGGWTLTPSSVPFAIGANKFFARALDNDGVFSDVANTTTNAVNAVPVIGSLSDSPDPVARKEQITLTANGVNDVDGTIVKVDFYRDSNNNGI